MTPIVAWLCRSAGKRPQSNAFAIHGKQVCDPADRPVWVRAQSRFTVEQVLRRIIGGIADEWLRVDHQPRLSLRPKHVAGVQVGC
jgi:hypothetical protein